MIFGTHCPETGQAESGGNGNFRDEKPGICGGYGRGRDTVFRHPQGYEGTEQLSATSADGFFNVTKVPETLRIYEIDLPIKRVAGLADNCIEKLSKADLRSTDAQLRRSVVNFTSDKFADRSVLDGGVCRAKFDLRPDFHNFDRLTKEFGLGISPRNYDVASLLYISENGYAGIVAADKVHPFSYEYEFRELAEKLGDSMRHG